MFNRNTRHQPPFKFIPQTYGTWSYLAFNFEAQDKSTSYTKSQASTFGYKILNKIWNVTPSIKLSCFQQKSSETQLKNIKLSTDNTPQTLMLF